MDAATRWTDDCQKIFDRIKEYLSTLSVLVLPEPGRPLFLYLVVLYGAFGCVLENMMKQAEKSKPSTISKAIKGQALTDHLPENPVDGEYEPLKMYFPDEEVSFIGEDIAESCDGWRLFFDGSANFKGVGIGAVLESQTIQYYPVTAKLRFPCTNNMAEYEAYILGLKTAIVMNVQELLVIVDSDLLIHQNEFADALATLSSMIQHPNINFIDPIPVKIYDQPAYCAHVEEEADGKPWFCDIKEYLTTGEYPELANATQKHTLHRLSNNFFHSGGILYKRTPD
ncbi:uncharacterized protein [Nicotiana sylvestris]|uniref:uncharacterized protein n=1 Tax=Nicotiana sylvestris TaxID=4096 RepID=UPI00388C35A5